MSLSIIIRNVFKNKLGMFMDSQANKHTNDEIIQISATFSLFYFQNP